MKRLASLLLVGLAGTAHGAGFENMMNPLGAFNPSGMSNPFAPSPFGYGGSPFGMGSPLGFGNPLGIGGPFGLGSPLGLGGLAVPLGLGLLNPLGGGLGGAMYPAMQVAPNMMSYQHMNQMANPYAGGPFAGNPYLQRGMPNPFSAPAFSPSMPTMPSMPFAAPQQQGGFANMLPAMPQQRMPQQPYYAMPYSGMPYSAPAAQQAVPANTPWSTGPSAPAAAQQAPAQAPAGFFLPFMMPPAQPPEAAPAPVAPPSAAALQNPLLFFPMIPQAGQPAPHPPAPPAAAEPAKVAPHPAAQPAENSAPLDPAAFMQMFMKPVPEQAK